MSKKDNVMRKSFRDRKRRDFKKSLDLNRKDNVMKKNSKGLKRKKDSRKSSDSSRNAKRKLKDKKLY